MSSPLVTVVVPAFNRARTIQAALKSIQAQSRAEWQTIVVDDGSHDGTPDTVLQLAREDGRISLLRHEYNRGAQAARNTGIQAAKTLWVAFLDSDDQWLPNSLEVRLAAAHKHEVSVVHSYAYVIDDHGRVSLKGVPTMDGWIYRDVLSRSGPVFQALLVRKDALERIDGLDEQIVAMQEWDTAIRLARYFRFAFVPVPTFVWDCRGEDTITKDRIRDAKGYEQVVRKHFWSMLRCAGPAAIRDHYEKLLKRYRWAGLEITALKYLGYSKLWAVPALVQRTLSVTKASTHIAASLPMNVVPTEVLRVAGAGVTLENMTAAPSKHRTNVR